MENCVDLKLLVKHLANGNFGDNYCIVCLTHLGKVYENIFTKVCKEDKEYCVADVLQKVCQVEFTEGDNYNVCVNCFMSASVAYKFYLTTKRSEEILSFYSEELLHNVESIDVSDENARNTLCIMPVLKPVTPLFDYDLSGIGTNLQEGMNKEVSQMKSDFKVEPKSEPLEDKSAEDVVIIIDETGEQNFFKLREGNLVPLDKKEMRTLTNVPVRSREKQRRKRDPMTFKSCPKCPVRYRFVSKLKEHMKNEHDMELYICKVCKATTTSQEEHEAHKNTHSGVHECNMCNVVYKKCDTIMTHLKWHEEMKNVIHNDGAHVCEVCGLVLENEQKLMEHNENKHLKKFTCYYCGRMYRGEVSFEMHIKKHEIVLSRNQDKPTEVSPAPVKKEEKRKCMCATCGRYFVDERSLLWHQRLHSNERPYTCDVCGRGFVSAARRKQHATCAHTPPARRCPLCPALFHLRSMVNTHIKKVHLKAHKRRYRVSKQREVCWRTQSVPIQELSVAVQGHILELQASAPGDYTSALPNHGTIG